MIATITSTIEILCSLRASGNPTPAVQRQIFHTFATNLPNLVNVRQGWLQQSDLPCSAENVKISCLIQKRIFVHSLLRYFGANNLVMFPTG